MGARTQSLCQMACVLLLSLGVFVSVWSSRAESEPPYVLQTHRVTISMKPFVTLYPLGSTNLYAPLHYLPDPSPVGHG